MKNVIKGYDSIFATRLRKLMEETNTTQMELALKTNITRQAISQYMDGSVLPNIEKLYFFSEYFNVTADYLLGKTSVKKPDTTIQAIAEYTGLSEKAIKLLNDLKNEKQSYSDGISFLIENLHEKF